VLESGVSAVGIPTTLHDSLMARLDRLSSVRLVAQIGAAIGREFSYALLRAVSRLPEDELQAALARLVASELVFQRGILSEAVYTFKHALVQDAAHGSLLHSTRQQLHAQIAEALEAHSPELMDSQPELFAQHYAEAGFVEKSVAYWGKAGYRSVARSVMAEAASQFQKGLDQLALLPGIPERQRQELELRNGLSETLLVVKGYAAPETGDAYARARELWEQLGSPLEFRQVPFGQSLYHMYRGELDLALRLDEDLLRLSSRRNDPAGLALAHISSGRDLFFAGKFASARWHAEALVALYDDPIFQSSVCQQLGFPPSGGSMGIVLFCLGFPERALNWSSSKIAESVARPQSLAGDLAFGIRLCLLVGDTAALGGLVDQLVTVMTEHGFPHWRPLASICRGWIQVKNGDVAEGISLLRSGFAASRGAWRPHNIALLAAACEIAEQIEEGLDLLSEALQIAERTGERWFFAELQRHKGQLLLRQGHTDAAEELYRKALRIAQEQEAKMWELRAATSLARLRRDRGRCAEAQELLAPVYGWFTEGFDNLDLKEAKSLLDELEGG
jgi:tetratricopeptide (TPR) repeat protein